LGALLHRRAKPESGKRQIASVRDTTGGPAAWQELMRVPLNETPS